MAGRAPYMRKVTGILRSLSLANVKSSRLSLSMAGVSQPYSGRQACAVVFQQVGERSSRAQNAVRGGGEVQRAKCDQFGDASRHRRLSALLISCDRHVRRFTEYLLLTSNLFTSTRNTTEAFQEDECNT